MAKSKANLDQFANKAIVPITMGAANTLTFERINMAVGQFQGVGLVVHVIEWGIAWATLKEIAGSSDWMALALTVNNSMTTLASTNPAVIETIEVDGIGTPVESKVMPLRSDFTNLPSGGLILPANPLFIGMVSAGFANPGSATARIWFSFKELADADYIELIQSQLPANIS